jgi:hypothetical protein
VELLRNGQRLGQPSPPLTCQEGCDEAGSRSYLYGGVLWSPRSGAPFGTGGLPNGSYELRALIEQSGGSPTAQPAPVVVSLPPSAVTNLAASIQDRTVQLSWNRAPEPDVVGYRLERRRPNDTWTVIDTLSPSTQRATDRPGTGTFEYRVITLRPNGTGTATLEAPSAVVSVTIRPEPSPSPTSPQPGGGDVPPGADDGASPAPDGGDGQAPDGDASAGSDGRTDASGTTRSNTSGRSSGSRPAAARAPSLSALRGNLPSLPSAAAGGGQPDAEVYYGERQGVGELDYSDLDPVSEATEDPEGEIVLEAGGLRSLDRIVDPERVAVPVAFGLLFTVVGLHLWRWLRVPI